MTMTEQTENQNEFSLATLAGYDATEIAAMTSRLPDAGNFYVEGVELKWNEPNQAKIDEGKDPLFSITFKAKILEAHPLDKQADAEKYVGRSLTDTVTLWPSDIQESIALLKGKFKNAGLSEAGLLGGVEGMEPGFLDGFPGSKMAWRVRRYTDGKNVERSAIDWGKIPGLESAENTAAA